MAYNNPYDIIGNYSGNSGVSPQFSGQAGQALAPAQQAAQQRFNTNMYNLSRNPLPTGPGYQQDKTFMGMNGNQAVSTGIGAIAGLADTLAQKSTDPMDFSVDKWAGYSGSAKGFASGGPWGAIIGGSLAQLGTFNKVHENLNNLQTGVNATQTDALGRPMYSGTDVTHAQHNLNALRKGVKAINTSVDPATHLISTIRGTERQLQRKRKALHLGVQAAQRDFNASANTYNQNQLAMNQYRDIMNKNNRMRSLYNIGNSTLY